MRSITCTNKSGISCTFGEGGFSPFLLADADGLYSKIMNVNTSSTTGVDGSVYHSSSLKQRNIVLTLKDIENYVDNRDFLNMLFEEKTFGELLFRDEDEERKIDYIVEKVTSDGSKAYRTHQVSLICPDPYFYDLYDHSFMMAAFVPAFSFAHAFMASKEEFGYRQKEKIKVINNELSIDGTGMTIQITCNGSVKNPSITRVEDHAHISIGTTTKPLSLVAGDVVTVTTDSGNKKVMLTHDGVTSSINQYLSEDSSFLQLRRGSNSLGYSADEGVDSMVLTISYRNRYTSA